LAPTFEAQEAIDSNDASVTMKWAFSGFNVLTTGDLGEKGQLRLLRTAAGDLAALSQAPLVLKVPHHGSADQSREFHQAIGVDVGLISVGLGNEYDHPTERELRILSSLGSEILRTDLMGALAIRGDRDGFQISSAGKLSM